MAEVVELVTALLELVESASDGESFRIGVLAGLLLREASEAPSELGLTKRQAELSSLVAQGLSNREVGERLGIAPATVKKHLEQIYERLGITNRTQLAVLLSRR